MIITESRVRSAGTADIYIYIYEWHVTRLTILRETIVDTLITNYNFLSLGFCTGEGVMGRRV